MTKTLTIWKKEVLGHATSPRAYVMVALLIFIASVFVLVSIMWQHTAAVAASTIVQDLGNGSVRSGVGVTAMILGWFGFGLLVVVTLATEDVGFPKGIMRPSHGGAAALRAPATPKARASGARRASLTATRSAAA